MSAVSAMDRPENNSFALSNLRPLPERNVHDKIDELFLGSSYVSRGYPFMAVTPGQLEREILAQKPFFPDNTAIYMTGSNPFALPAGKLRKYISVLRKHFPNFTRMQSRIDDIASKSTAELRELCGLGLSHLYIGTENGNDAVLALMNKGHSASETVEQLLRLDEAGITYTTFYIIGMGAREWESPAVKPRHGCSIRRTRNVSPRRA